MSDLEDRSCCDPCFKETGNTQDPLGSHISYMILNSGAKRKRLSICLFNQFYFTKGYVSESMKEKEK